MVDLLRLQAVSFKWPSVGGQPGFLRLLRTEGRRCRREGADLVLFPAFFGLTLLDGLESWSFGSGLSRTVARRGDFLRDTMVRAGAGVAAELGIYLSPGSFFVPAGEGEGFNHVAQLFSPRGELILEAAQVHVAPWERDWGLRGGEEFPVADLPWGKAGFLVGADAWYPEAGRILALQGADLLLAPVTVPAPLNEAQALVGVWTQAQGNQVYALEAGLWGRGGDLELAGRAAAYGPCELTGDGSGFLGAAPAVDRAALGRVRESYPIFGNLNPQLYRRHLAGAWENLP